MARFHSLEVTDVRHETRDSVVLTLKPRKDECALFDFTQGQYLTFRRQFDGIELRRSYSICAGKDEGVLKVGIKRVDGGAFSTWANEHLKAGEVIEAMPPMGNFHTPIEPDQSKNYLGFAGGSGITPLLSIIKTVLAREPKSRFTLVYANRQISSIMFGVPGDGAHADHEHILIDEIPARAALLLAMWMMLSPAPPSMLAWWASSEMLSLPSPPRMVV